MSQAIYQEVRDRYAKLVSEQANPALIAAHVAHAVGMCDQDGRRYFREDGAPTLAEKPKKKPKDFKFDVLAEAIIGRNWRTVLQLDRSEDAFSFIEHQRQAQRVAGRELTFREEAAAPIGPSVFANVAAWSATVGGLMGAQFTLGYETAKFDLVDLFPIRPAVFWQGGERYIDIIGPYQPAQLTGPGEEYPDTSMSAMWVEPGPMYKYAEKISLTKETLAIDISGGQILSKANGLGENLKFRENELSLDVICGQTNNWKLGFLTDTGATAYNTYGPTITSPAGVTHTVPNDIVNPMNDIGAFQISDLNISRLRHPVTDYPLEVQLDTALFPTPLAAWADALNGVSQVNLLTQTTAGPAQPAPGQFPTAMLQTNNPWRGSVRGMASRWLDYRQQASTTQPDPNRTAGLGLTGAAIYRWYRLNPAQFACRRQMWPATSQAVSPGDWVMVTQGIVAAFAADIATMVQVLNPYAIQRNRAS